MTSSGTSHGPRRRPREATSTTPCRSGTTIGPNSARTGAVHRSSAQSRPTGPRAVRAHPSPAGTAATGATHHDRHARDMMKQGLGAAFVPPAPHPGCHQRTVTWNDPTQHSPRRRFAVAAARGIVYDIDVHSFRLDGAPRSSCHLPPSRNSAARVRGRSFVVRVSNERPSCPAVYQRRRVTTRARQAHLMVKQQQCWLCCAAARSSRCCGRGYEGACKRTL